jgi:hypothetical protein
MNQPYCRFCYCELTDEVADVHRPDGSVFDIGPVDTSGSTHCPEATNEEPGHWKSL